MVGNPKQTLKILNNYSTPIKLDINFTPESTEQLCKMSSPSPPPYDDATDISRFHDLMAYASTRGAYLLQDSQYQIFNITYENNQDLNYILTEFTIPIATRNI